MDHDALGTQVTEMVYRVAIQKQTAWEERMRLYIKPRPRWMPERVWRRLVQLVFVQTSTR